jgi:hypothetical protein
MYHTSPNRIEAGTIKSWYGVAGDCLFFADDIYVMTQANEYYIYEAHFYCVRASELYDNDIVVEIAERFLCDQELAESLLDASADGWEQEFEFTAEDSWWLQGKRGECAVAMGYDGCEDTDEHGRVYIVPMSGRESELTLIGTESRG